MSYWYVLFVMTGKEMKVGQYLNKRLNNDVYRPFIPLSETIFKKSGQIKKEVKPLFSSYLFIETELNNLDFYEGIKSIAKECLDIIRLLSYTNGYEYSLRESEMKMLLSLGNDEYCIESSSGIIEGNRIHITDGPLKGRESIVKKVDRHKRQAWIEIDFMGEKREVSVGVEIIEKI